MDKAIFNGMKKIVKEGEKIAPIKSAKMKVKFDTKAVEGRKDTLAKKMSKK